MLSPGQASDIAHAQPLLNQVRIPGKPGRPRKRSRWLLADKGYDAEHLRHYCGRYRIQPVIPLRAMPRKPRPGLPRLFDRPKYRQRNIIERMFGWLKENRRIVTRYDKLAKSYAAMVTLACSLRCIRQYFSQKTQGGYCAVVPDYRPKPYRAQTVEISRIRLPANREILSLRLTALRRRDLLVRPGLIMVASRAQAASPLVSSNVSLSRFKTLSITS